MKSCALQYGSKYNPSGQVLGSLQLYGIDKIINNITVEINFSLFIFLHFLFHYTFFSYICFKFFELFLLWKYIKF